MDPISSVPAGFDFDEANSALSGASSESELAKKFTDFFVDSEMIDIVMEDEEDED